MIDDRDGKIPLELQVDGRPGWVALAVRVNLSAAACCMMIGEVDLL